MTIFGTWVHEFIGGGGGGGAYIADWAFCLHSHMGGLTYEFLFQ